ncbi:glycosyltransferase family 4 protein [Nitrospirillum amazonense]|uniref:Glycosyltransferase involved in cell wall biosynthesis n=1 Tax=Nitrospirillum amazonense TaxID=28077 RepID=A0A560JPZ0_9PROT|nr:glycosyltransferase family 1 protein [Nitrospirillum amazonense]MDG3442318.1 glycosyltransferase family 1 protein [Nitrospirillum amazonense]TWB73185.1 glycosyltransferase involved in cell wall biosynthesis [Nitrospirillum amazonense]
MKILIVTDAWHPQVNGVVRTLTTTRDELRQLGHEVEVIAPDRFRTVPMPTYPEIRLALKPGARLRRMIDEIAPDAIHIATEGPLGLAARRYCLRRRIPFTTAYHTRFPEYVRDRFPIPLRLSYALVRRFHAPASAVMVATPSIENDLVDRGFRNIKRWSRGVDTDLFRPREKDFLPFPRPIFMYVGRVAVEKNIEAFLSLDLPGTKVVVGGGPQLDELKAKYPAAQFVGPKHGEELAKHYAAGDVFVFPSRTDTFGLVLLEALASGVPVAAYPVPGPLDVLAGSDVAVLDEDLRKAALAALEIPGDKCRRHALTFSWSASAAQFLNNLRPFRGHPALDPAPALDTGLAPGADETKKAS